MNVFEIEALVRSAEHLRNYERDSKGDKVHDQILDRVAEELSKVETADEVAKLQHSSNIKQANLNQLAGKALAVTEALKASIITSYPVALDKAREELEALAKNLIQEEPAVSAAG